MCGLTIQQENGQITSIRGNRDDPFSEGAFCPKSQGLKDLYHDPDRLKQPLKRTADGFKPISWQQAFDEIAEKTQTIRKKHGKAAVGTYLGNPNVHNLGSMMFLPFFLQALKTPNHFSATSVDQLPHMLVSYWMFGHQLQLPIADVDHTDCMLIIGANPAVSNGSLLSAPGLSSRLKKIRHRGGKVFVLDPRYTETSSLATEHHFIRPGTDVFFLASFLKTIFDRSAVRLQHLEPYLEGLDEVKKLLSSVDLERASQITGVTQETVHHLVDEFLAHDRAICYGRIGVSTQKYGTLCQWLIYLINIVTGNFDRQGGVMFTQPAFDIINLMAKMGRRGSYNRRQTRVRKLPEFGGEFPCSALAEEILTPGKGQIKALFTVAGNPVLSTPNGSQLERALDQLDLQVAIDFYINETTRKADYILPPTTSLEHSHYDIIFNSFAIRNNARYSPPLYSKPKGAYEDWEIMLELWSRLDPNPTPWRGLSRTAGKKVLLKLGPEFFLDLGLRSGPYGLGKQNLSLRKLKQQPNGIDLGPLKPSVPQRLFHKDKKIHLMADPIVSAWQDLWTKSAELITPPESDTLQLIGRRSLRSNNSWMHNCSSLLKGKNPCFVFIHPDDAAKHNISTDQDVTVSSPVGSITLPARLTQNIMPGVISIPHGWGHHREGSQMQWAAKHAGVSLNDITDESHYDPVSGNAAFNGQPVTIRPVTDKASG
jgi:anaerobic selenocysteine-containing dehydrogenase